MKNLFLFSIILIQISCSRSPVNAFIDSHNQKRGTISATIPGWLVRAGSDASFTEWNDDDIEGWQSIAEKLGRIRFLTAEEGIIDIKDVKNLISEAKSLHFEEYVTVRNKDKIINVMVRQDKDKVKELLVVVSASEFVIAHIESDISIYDLEKAQLSWNEERRKNNH